MSTLAVNVSGFVGEVERIAGTRRDLYRYCVKSRRRGVQLVSGFAGDVDEALDSVRAHVRYIVESGSSTRRA